MAKKLIFTALLILLIGILPVQAQEPLAETDSETFITTHFQLQAAYSRVLCVSGDGSCPAEIETAAPCLTAACILTAQTYPISANFDTIQAAWEAALPGDLIIIMPGRYAGLEAELRGGENGAYIHFLGWGEPGSVIIDSPADPTKGYLRHHFYMIAVHHLLIQNLSFEGAEGAGVFVSGYFSATGQFSHHIIVDDIYSHDNGVWGLHTTATSYVLVQDSIFTNSGEEHGAYFSGSGDHMLIRRNVFQNNAASGVQVNPDPQTAVIELFYWLQNSTGNTCQWTDADVEFTGTATWADIKACYDSQGLPDLGEFIEDGFGTDFIIEQNVITGNGALGGGGINLAAMQNTKIRNNLVYGNDAAAITCWDNDYFVEKNLAESPFGCQNVQIYNNTMVDETGGRGSLILNHFARNITLRNNVIIRDRFDALELSIGSSATGNNNYYSLLAVDETSQNLAENLGITDFSVAEGLAQFVNPNFENWVLEDGAYPTLNPNRPDFRPLANSILATGGDTSVGLVYDAMGMLRSGTEIGALAASTETGTAPVEVVAQPTAETPIENTAQTAPVLELSPQTVTYTLNGQVYLLQVGGTPQNISETLNATSTGWDEWLNISPDGQWLLLRTERFDERCVGWPCLVLFDRSLSTPELITLNGEPVRADGFSAVGSGGAVIVFQDAGQSHARDLFVIRRESAGWTTPLLLTGESPYQWHSYPAISADGLRVIFDCGDQPYAGEGTNLCEINTDGTGFRVVLPPTSPTNFVHHADYAPDGGIVYESNQSGEFLWRLDANGSIQLAPDANNDNAPCVFSDGRIASLWLGRADGQGLHELKLLTNEGAVMLVTDVDIADIGLGCGG